MVVEPQISLCGNGVVEEGEECDCGWEGDCREPCCYPQRRHPPPGETPCRLTPRSICSPSQVNNHIISSYMINIKINFLDNCRDPVVQRNVHYGSATNVVPITVVGILPIVTVDDHIVPPASVNQIALCVMMVSYAIWGYVKIHNMKSFH